MNKKYGLANETIKLPQHVAVKDLWHRASEQQQLQEPLTNKPCPLGSTFHFGQLRHQYYPETTKIKHSGDFRISFFLISKGNFTGKKTRTKQTGVDSIHKKKTGQLVIKDGLYSGEVRDDPTWLHQLNHRE